MRIIVTVIYKMHFICTEASLITVIKHSIFTPDSIYAIARICYRPPLCPSVRLSCLSDGGIIEKRLKLGLWNFHYTVAPSL